MKARLVSVLVLLLLLPRDVQALPETESTAVPATVAKSDTGFESRVRAVVARPGGLTARDAGRLAQRRSLQTRTRRTDVDAARAEVDRAVAGYLPRLTLSARYVRLSSVPGGSLGPEGANLVATPSGEGPLPPGAPLLGVPSSALGFPVILDQYSLQAAVTVPLSDYLLRTPQTHEGAKHAVVAAELGVEAAKRAARASGELAYHDWVRARLATLVAEEGVAQAGARLDAARTLRDLDRAVDADVFGAEAKVARAELSLERARTLAAVAEQSLRTLLGASPGATFAIGEDPLRALPAERSESAAGLVAEAARRRPELASLERTAASLEKQSEAARTAAWPRLDAFANAYYANPSPRVMPQRNEWRATWDVGAQLTWTPNDVLSSASSSASLSATLARTRLERARMMDALRDEVVAAQRALVEARRACTTADRGLVAATEAHRARVEQYEAGRLTSVELTDAELALSQARLEVIDARVGWRAARTRLDFIVGR